MLNTIFPIIYKIYRVLVGQGCDCGHGNSKNCRYTDKGKGWVENSIDIICLKPQQLRGCGFSSRAVVPGEVMDALEGPVRWGQPPGRGVKV